jgi:TRAP transporter TAXI family solute receptor
VIGALRAAAGVLLALFSCAGAAKAAETEKPKSITIGTASPGGVYLVYGQVVARILSRALHIEVTAEATQGAVQNIILLEKRQAMLGFTNLGPALTAWNGADWAKGTQYRSMRIIFPMYDTVLQFTAAKRLRIASLADFAGLRIGGGPRAGTSGAYTTAIFKALGIAAIIRHEPWENIESEMENGELDGAASAIGAPTPIIVKLEAKQLIDFIEPTPEQVAAVREKLPEMMPSFLRAGTYRSLTQDYHSIGLYNFAVAHKDLPDDLVYLIVKAVFANHGELVKAHPSAADTIPANIGRDTIIPLHPGAMRYYREAGIALPPGAGGHN